MKQENYIKKSLLWDITRRCNLSCIHCYNSGGISTEQELEIAAQTPGCNQSRRLGADPRYQPASYPASP